MIKKRVNRRGVYVGNNNRCAGQQIDWAKRLIK